MEDTSSRLASLADLLTFADVEAAAERLEGQARHTPVMRSASIDEATGARVAFKCENFQRVGAFKFRGAFNAVSLLDEMRRAGGVATHSSGNHGAALALAARLHGARASVVMPEGAAASKVAAVRAYGAEVIFCEPTQAGRESALEALVERTGAAIVHPYDDPHVMAGQGTAALEFLNETGALDVLLVPVGGGGLFSGSAVTAKTLHPRMSVIGVEPAGADDALRSWQTGAVVPVSPATIADGLRATVSADTLRVMRALADDIVTVPEAAIVQAMRLVWERMKIIIEPSAATVLAAMICGAVNVSGLRVGAILSGGNLDLDRLPWQTELL